MRRDVMRIESMVPYHTLRTLYIPNSLLPPSPQDQEEEEEDPPGLTRDSLRRKSPIRLAAALSLHTSTTNITY